MDVLNTMFRFLEAFLPRSQSRSVYAFTMACYIIAIKVVGTRLVAVFGLWHVRTEALPSWEYNAQLPLANIILVDLVASPIVESLVLIGTIELFRRFGCKDFYAVIISTCLICLLHSSTVPIHGLLAVPTFLIGTASYVYWRRIASFWTGFGMIVFLHFCANIIPVLNDITRTL